MLSWSIDDRTFFRVGKKTDISCAMALLATWKARHLKAVKGGTRQCTGFSSNNAYNAMKWDTWQVRPCRADTKHLSGLNCSGPFDHRNIHEKVSLSYVVIRMLALCVRQSQIQGIFAFELERIKTIGIVIKRIRARFMRMLLHNKMRWQAEQSESFRSSSQDDDKVISFEPKRSQVLISKAMLPCICGAQDLIGESWVDANNPCWGN